MAAPLNQNQLRYFHGTGGAVDNGVVTPMTPRSLFGGGKAPARSMDQLAFASDRVSDAKVYAAGAARGQGRLFGSVYEVTPRNPRPSPMGNPHHVADDTGLDVKKHVGFVNREGDWANQ